MDKLIKKLEQAPPNLKEVLQDVKNRYIAIENEPKRDDKRKQRLDMIKMFQVIISKIQMCNVFLSCILSPRESNVQQNQRSPGRKLDLFGKSKH